MKKLMFVSAMFVALGICFSVYAQSTVQSGKFQLTTKTAGYTLDKNEGDRAVSIEVDFNTPFDVRPKVILAVTQVDMDRNTNQRYNVEAISVSRDGFTVRVSTWGDSRIYGVAGYWIAHTED